MGAGIFGIFILFAIAAVIIRLAAGSFDGNRIEAYIRERGWTLVDKSWDPFGPGWFGEKDSRIYQIVYKDTQGDLHKAHVKTSLLSGVYLTQDEIVQKAEAQPSSSETTHLQELEEENRRLKEELNRLKA